MVDFCRMAPDELIKLDLNKLSREELRTLDYFVWCFYPEEPEAVTAWRFQTLLPHLESLGSEEVDDDDEWEDEEIDD